MLFRSEKALALSLSFLALALVLPAIAEESQPGSREARLETREGVRVLVLTGTAREQGLEQGRALADEIVQAAGVIDKLRSARAGKDLAAHKALLAKFKWSDDASAEIDGIVAGVKERLGVVKVPGTDRDFARFDVEAVNTVCDLLPFGCSSFTITGERVEGGLTLTARNLDYPVFDDSMLEKKLIVVHARAGNLHGWATVSWPGLIGCYTGMNDEGITACIHDVEAGREEMPMRSGLTPRSLGLRAILENVGKGEGFEKRAAEVLRRCPVIYGNNIHVSGPGSSPPAAILEWDPDQRKDGGVTIRASDGGEPLVCTNHWRLRKEPEKCRRYAALVKTLAEHKEPFTPESALVALRASGQRGKLDLTVHSVVFCPERRTVLAAFAKEWKTAAAFEQGVSIDLGELFDSSSKAAKKTKKWW
ncbi:hypothetical protein HY251_00020 [bacterium]|nr:hypothetical protein [bacterium]